MKRRIKNLIRSITLQTKLVFLFIATTVIVLTVNLFMYFNVNDMVTRLDEIYLSNVSLNELSDSLSGVQTGMTDYLNTKSSDSIEEYYRNVQEYNELLEKLNQDISNNDLKMMERNIRNMSENYLELTNQTIEAKRGRNVEKYKIRYENATEIYQYINTYIYSLNNEQFKNNSTSYQILSFSLHYLELVSTFILIVVALCNVVLIILVTRTITNPLKNLATVANQVAGGNFEVGFVEVHTHDEVGVVSSAFNKMVISIRVYIERIRESMEMERAMQEKELLMETHLKDAQLKYLQAQINPHFLFNTLNAGAQLAMMEGADKTYKYVQNVAQFFRYNIRKNNGTVPLKDEISLVDNYIYILNVRFSGEIQFEKQVDETLTKMQIPSMILQPIVENSVNYGIRGIEWQGIITLSVYQDGEDICVSIRDNGIGMSQEKIDGILSNELKSSELSADSNGIGIGNVISRLKIFFDREDVIHITSEGENKGTEVILCIPGAERKTEHV